MNKESFKRRAASVKKLFKALMVKTRYRSTYALKYILKTLIKHITVLATKLAELIAANKRRIALGAVSCVVLAFCGLSLFNAFTAYQYSYNGEVLGVVDEPSSVYEGIEIAEETLSEEIGAEVVIDEEEDINLTRILKNSSVDDEKDVVNALTSLDGIKVVTYAITINSEKGEELIQIDTKENAEQVLAALKEKFYGKYSEEDFLDISFEQDVEIKESKAALTEIISTPDALELIMTGGIEEKVHVVKRGEVLSEICKKYDVTQKQVKEWNEDLKESTVIHSGQKIQMVEQIPLIDVITKRNDTFKEEYGPETDYTDTDKLYVGMEKTIKEGKSGNRTVNADIIEKNGEPVDRIDHKYTVHKEQVASKVYRGTKERPEKIGKGYYSMPISGKFTSSFGYRWGSMHNGIDVCGPIGTNVYAADAGIVTAAGATSNGYGVAVKINHGNGRSTYYAHNSEVLVKVGEIVYRGQHIAESGNTGNSSGPHLHFETHFNGVPKNPMKYL